MLALALLATLAALDDPPVETFTSPSGAWTLTVTRRERTWNGAAELVLVHDGIEAYRVEHELGLREVCVSDDGRVAGYGYTGRGHDGHPGSQRDYPRGKDMRVFVLDERGALLLDESHPRGAALYPCSDPNPLAAGALLLPDLRRFIIVRVYDEDLNRGVETWWGYDLDTGAALPRVRPSLVLEQEGSPLEVRTLHGTPLGVCAVPGTPLVLLHWAGSTFQLLDADLRPVWTLDVPRDLESLDPNERYALKLRSDRGNIVATSDRTFELRLVADASIVAYAVEHAADGWTITETARRPDPDAKPTKKPKPRAR
jgi:hypothetical protein